MNPPTRPSPPPFCDCCGRNHRKWRTFAACNLRPILWVCGSGPFASVSDCPISGRGEGRTLQLYPTREEAEAARAMIDRTGCGGCCRRMHRIIDLRALARRQAA